MTVITAYVREMSEYLHIARPCGNYRGGIKYEWCFCGGKFLQKRKKITFAAENLFCDVSNHKNSFKISLDRVPQTGIAKFEHA